MVVGIVSALDSTCFGTLLGSYSRDIYGTIWTLHEMSEKRLDGKAELERALKLHQASADNYHVGNMYPLKDRGVIEGSQLLITSSSNTGVSMLQDELIAIEFKNRDALLEALCIKTLGAKPIYTND